MSGRNAVEFDVRLSQGAFALAAAAEVGAATAVVGPSGAGKTTLLHALAGLRRAEGRVVVDDRVLQDTGTGVFLPPEERQLGLVPQGGHLFPHLSVRRNLLFGAPGRRRRGSRSAEGEAAARGGPRNDADVPGATKRSAAHDFDEVVAALDLAPLLDRAPRHLSGGEERRVALGRALLARPRLLLLDEPTAGLDADRARRARARILRMTDELAIPRLVVTHSLPEALALADRVIVLDAGRVVAAGPSTEILAGGTLGRAAPGERATNVVHGTVAAHRPDDGETWVDTGGDTPLALPLDKSLEIGAPVVLSVDAEEILVATTEPAGLSARNVLAGPARRVWRRDGSVYVEVESWVASLTPRSADSLGVTEGRRLWLAVKAHSWRVLAG